MAIVKIKHDVVEGNDTGFAVIDTDYYPTENYEVYEEPAPAPEKPAKAAPAPAATPTPTPTPPAAGDASGAAGAAGWGAGGQPTS